MKVSQIILFFALFLGLCSCEAMQDSAGRAFDNAGSVIKTGEEKAYIPPEPKKKPRSDIQESDYQRY